MEINLTIPLVTVCITTYNRDYILSKAINSVRNQSYSNLEIHIIDDCSTDSTNDICKNASKIDKRISFFSKSTNSGLSNSRNISIYKANGTYWTFLDDDDTWHCDFVSRFIDVAIKYPDHFGFFCQNNISIESSFKEIILKGFTPPGSAQFYNTSIVRRVGGYNESIKSGVDHDLWISLACHNAMVKSIPLSLSRLNTDSTQSRITTRRNERITMISQSLYTWKPKIISCFGENFYKHFKKNYYFYLYRKYLFEDLKKLKIKNAVYLFFRMPLKHQLIPYLLKSKSQRNINPTFIQKK